MLVIICVLIWLFAWYRRESFETKPTSKEANAYAEQLVQNVSAIHGGLEQAKKKMSWLDSITYEDARMILKNGKLNLTAAKSIIPH
jgi:hypothetical protein